MHQQVQRARISPLQVVDQHDQTTRGRRRCQVLGHRLEQRESAHGQGGRGSVGCGQVGRIEVGYERRFAVRFRRVSRGQPAQDLPKRPVRRAPFVGGRPAVANEHARVSRPIGDLKGQPGLPDTRFTEQQGDLAGTVGRRPQEPVEAAQLIHPTDELNPDVTRHDLRSPTVDDAILN
jgi:hypothetical protein